MYLESLPDELIEKLLSHLLDDGKSFVNFARTCKRHNMIAKNLVYSPLWNQHRPTSFNANLPAITYSISSHLLQSEPCECQTYPSSATRINAFSNVKFWCPRDLISDCIYGRLFCLLNAKHTRFSGLKLEQHYLSENKCLKCFQDFKSSVLGYGVILMALVELELKTCCVSQSWLSILLKELPSLSYLTLEDLRLIPKLGHRIEETSDASKRKLVRLRLSGLICVRIYNEITKMFMTREFDVTRLEIDSTATIIRLAVIRPNLSEPNRVILSIMSVLPFLKQTKSTLELLILNRTNLELGGLRRLLLDDELKELKIIAKDCPKLNHQQLVELTQELGIENTGRLCF